MAKPRLSVAGQCARAAECDGASVLLVRESVAADQILLSEVTGAAENRWRPHDS